MRALQKKLKVRRPLFSNKKKAFDHNKENAATKISLVGEKMHRTLIKKKNYVNQRVQFAFNVE